ncbi:MAG: polysaccharide deacetylase family protein [Solirubrobacterales bacterium]
MSHPLALAGGRVNLVFHDVSDTARSRYAVPVEHLLDSAEQLHLAGLSQSVRFYFDDGYASARAGAQLLRERYPEIEVVAALTITAIGETGYLTWGDVEEMRSWGVQIAGHGYQHVRLAAYRNGAALQTSADGTYRAAPTVTDEAQLSANEVLFQLTETRDALHGLARCEFVLPYGAYNRDVVNINERHQLFSVLSTADYDWDLGGEIRPRLLVTRSLSPRDIPDLLASPWPGRAAG